ncbi:hypothetical protein [Brachybacterium sacelli]|uniref:Uncharacterized protein n=1 Tax=Brachybacterium sacelli TaxID=173364 RepID=A0ABS4X5K8_9MICO|nr:hypothetical protein [Brachybacterium sacelli]MBP2383725.1 hypothetical protein [Brachybacterium sacelli]
MPTLDYPRTTVRAGTAAVVPGSTLAAGDRPALVPGTPGWVHLSPDGTLTVTPPRHVRAGLWSVTVEVRTSTGSTRFAIAELDVQGAVTPEAEQHELDPWCEVELASSTPGGVAAVTVDGGKPLPPNAHVETSRQGSRLRCIPVGGSTVWVPSPRLVPSIRLRVVYSDGSTNVVDAGLRLPVVQDR